MLPGNELENSLLVSDSAHVSFYVVKTNIIVFFFKGQMGKTRKRGYTNGNGTRHLKQESKFDNVWRGFIITIIIRIKAKQPSTKSMKNSPRSLTFIKADVRWRQRE